MKSGAPPAYQYGEVNCGKDVLNPTTTFQQNPAFRWGFGAGVWSSGNDKHIPLGTRYLNNNPNGVCYNAPFAISGWTWADHINTSKVTNAAITAYYQLVGIPTHLWFFVGQNAAPGDYANLSAGNNTSYRNGYNQMIDRHLSIISALGGAPPKVCMVSQFATSDSSGVSYGFNFFDQMSLAHYQIAQSRGKQFSTLNLYRCTGGESLQRIPYNCLHFVYNDTADMIHPNRYGGSFFTLAMQREITAAINYTAGRSSSGRGSRVIR